MIMCSKMKLNKTLRSFSLLLIWGIAAMAIAQTSSPYSRYGIGNLQQKGSTRSRMMGGTGVANQNKTDVNNVNPSALVAMDSMAVLFDVGFHANASKFSSSEASETVYSGNLDYVSLMIPMRKYWFVSVSMQPLSSVGYDVYDTKEYNGSYGDYYGVSYSGDGGMSLATVTNSLKLPWGISVGAETGFMWGNHDETITEYYSDMDVSYTSRQNISYYYGAWINTGMQIAQTFGKMQMILGATYDVPTTVRSYTETSYTSSVEIIDESTGITTKNSLPEGYGIGLSVTYDQKLTLSGDYRIKKWEDTGLGVDPQRLCNNNIYSLGAEYIPKSNSNKYIERISYRAGAHYESGSFEVYNTPVSSAYVSAGVGLPGRLNNTLISVGFEWGVSGGFDSRHITETYGRINVGLNLGEIWFMKPKFY